MSHVDLEVSPCTFDAPTWHPDLETCVEAFGSRPCMFESTFPVDKGSYPYSAYWNAAKRLARGASAAEKAHLGTRAAHRPISRI